MTRHHIETHKRKKTDSLSFFFLTYLSSTIKTHNVFYHLVSSIRIGDFNICHCALRDSPDKIVDQ